MLPPLTQETVIARSKEVHGDKYDYSKTVYTGTKNSMVVICPVHGLFKTNPATHMGGSGCRKCGRDVGADKHRKTLLPYLAEAKLRHKGKYTYDRAVYTLAKAKIIVTCPIHGDFKVEASSHLYGTGCVKCAYVQNTNLKRGTNEKFIAKAIKQHGDKYVYDEVVYVNSKTKVVIICPTHGRFEQTPGNHIFGYGCPGCGFIKCGKSKRGDTARYVTRAKSVHGDRYDYSDVNFLGMHERIDIICREHGKFVQIANGHIQGSGCPKCGRISAKRLLSHTKTGFLETLTSVQRKDVDFSKLEYVNMFTKGVFLCKICDWKWEQTPDSFRTGAGCAMCNPATPAPERTMRKYLEKYGAKDLLVNNNHLPENTIRNPYRFDFLFTDRKILIELDDKYHYPPALTHGPNYERWVGKHKRDLAKNKLVRKQGYVLLRIAYTEFGNLDQLSRCIMKMKKPTNPIGSVHLLSITKDNTLNVTLIT